MSLRRLPLLYVDVRRLRERDQANASPQSAAMRFKPKEGSRTTDRQIRKSLSVRDWIGFESFLISYQLDGSVRHRRGYKKVLKSSDFWKINLVNEPCDRNRGTTIRLRGLIMNTRHAKDTNKQMLSAALARDKSRARACLAANEVRAQVAKARV